MDNPLSSQYLREVCISTDFSTNRNDTKRESENLTIALKKSANRVVYTPHFLALG
jgi:hypothetical protein